MPAASVRIKLFGKLHKLRWKVPTVGSLNARYNYLISGVEAVDSDNAFNLLTAEIEEIYFIFGVTCIALVVSYINKRPRILLFNIYK